MNKPVTLTVITIGTLISISVIYLLVTSNTKEMPTDTATSEQVQQLPTTNKTPIENQSVPVKGVYVDYREVNIATTTGTKLLFFHAPWCPQCRDLEDDIKKGVPDNVTIFKVDYDSNQKLRQKYGVTIQTTIVRVDDSGNLIQKFVAYDDPTLAAVTKELLQ